MVIVDFEGKFLNAKSCADGEIAEITAEGVIVKVEFKKGEPKDVPNIPVKYKGKDMVWSPTMTQGQKAVEAWGTDTKDWVGKKFQTFEIDGGMSVKPLLV